MESNLSLQKLIQTDQDFVLWELQVGFVALGCNRCISCCINSPVADHMDVTHYRPDAVCFSDVAAAASQALDREIVYQDMPRDAFRQLMLEEAGFTPETVDLGVMCHLDAFRAGKARRVTTDFQRLTRRQPTSVQQWWCQHAAMFLSDPESQDRA